MRIITKSLSIIDLDNEKYTTRSIPADFNEYIENLILYIENNEDIKRYKSRSLTTEVVALSISMSTNNKDKKYIDESINTISNRLLKKEITNNSFKNVQKGSLIQSLLYDEKTNKYKYLLASIKKLHLYHHKGLING